MQIAQQPFFILSYEPDSGILKLVWSEGTARMTDEDFKAALVFFAEKAEEFKAKELLVDVEKFRFNMPSQLGEWRAQSITPRYNKAGVRKFAFVHGEKFSEKPGDGERYQGEEFLTRHFSSEQGAKKWLQQAA